MEDDVEKDLIIHSIIKELIKLKKQLIMPHFNVGFAQYYLRLLLYDPTWNVSIKHLVRESIQNFIDFLIFKFKNCNTPGMITLMMQYYCQHRLSLMEGLAEKRMEKMYSNLKSLREHIVQGKTKTDLTEIFHKIVMYTLLMSEMGDPKNPKVIEACTHVLKSVLNLSELENFYNLSPNERLEELNSIVMVCKGIRLFNMDCKKCDIGIPKMPSMITSLIESLSLNYSDLNHHIKKRYLSYTEVAITCYKFKRDDDKILLVTKIPEKASMDDLNQIKQLILTYKHYYDLTSSIIKQIQSIKTRSEKLQVQYEMKLRDIHKIVDSNILINSHIIFPQFKQLSNLWSRFSDKFQLLQYLVDTHDNLREFINYLYIPQDLLYNYEHKIHADISEFDLQEVKSSKCTVFSFPLEKHEHYEFRGHCCVMLVLTGGLLLEGKPRFGVVEFNNLRYVFSSRLAIEAFVKDPDFFVKSVLNLARRECQIAVYLKLYDKLEEVKTVWQLIPKKEKKVSTQNHACQSEDHFTGALVDPNYSSSTWWHKRRAQYLAYLRQCKTTSTQTIKCDLITELGTQTWGLQERATQTMINAQTGTGKVLSYMYGLRGDKEDRSINLRFKL